MSVRAIFKVFRTNEWWSNKIPAILAIGYATSIKNEISLLDALPSISLVFISIVAGAIYVSSINDLTDIEEDLKSGKSNRMAKIPRRYHWLIPMPCIGIGAGFFYFYSADTLSAILYLLPWITFSLYSFKPVRLKQRGFWGVIADACGAHVFIGLLMVSYITYVSNKSLDILWFSWIGIWSLLFGLRGILWHQFYDRDHDLKVQSTTFATKTAPARFKKQERTIFALELAAFALILNELSINILYIAVLAYCAFAFLRYKALGQKMVMVHNPPNQPFQILLLDLYQVFFPFALLIYICAYDDSAWILFIAHVIIFPGRLLNIGKDSVVAARLILRKASRNYQADPPRL